MAQIACDAQNMNGPRRRNAKANGNDAFNMKLTCFGSVLRLGFEENSWVHGPPRPAGADGFGIGGGVF